MIEYLLFPWHLVYIARVSEVSSFFNMSVTYQRKFFMIKYTLYATNATVDPISFTLES